MRVRPCVGSITALLVLSTGVACSSRNLELGTGMFKFDGGPSDTLSAPTDGAPPVDGPTGGHQLDAAESPCVTASVQLPWTISSSTLLRLDVAATADAVAVINRQTKQTDVRTYARDGRVISGFQFGADAQFLPYSDARFLLVTRGTTGEFVATAIAPDLRDSTRLFTSAANATEHVLGAIALSTMSIVVITDEHFVNIATGTIVPWSTVLGAADRDAFKLSRIFGMAAQSDRVMLAWGTNSALRLAVVGADGDLITRNDDSAFFSAQGSDSATAAPIGNGLLMFDGNPVRLTQIAFDLSRTALGQNMELRTFYRQTPKVAAISLLGRPIAFWLTVFPVADNSQGVTTHQLYGCELDVASPAACLGVAPIAATGLGGYGIAQQPVAAAAVSGDGTFAVAHTDGDGASWLRIANLGCARSGAP